MAEEIIRTKKYAKPDTLFCSSCPHCISYLEYGDCENYYCLVDDEYKFIDAFKDEDCPFNQRKEN